MAWPKLSRQARGYGAAWERVRKMVLARDCGMCQCKHCKASGYPLIANEVDHIVPKVKAQQLGWTQARMDDPSNLQSINSECHKRKTKEDEGRSFQPARSIGVDGFPIEPHT